MPYRLRTKQLFLTYPQCDVTKEDMYLFLYENLSPAMLIVAHELHENGDNHLHVYAKLDVELDTRDPRYFDYMGYHGNYQGCRGPKNVMKYCTKADDYVSNFDVAELLDAAKTHKKAGLKALVEGTKRPYQLVSEDSGLLLGYKKLKGDYDAYRVDTYKKTMCNIKAYWYWGESRLGKSWKALTDAGADVKGEMKNVYFKSINKWWDGYQEEEIVLMDEVPKDAEWLLTFLKRWTDSIPELVETKGGFVSKQWKTFIVTSNHSIRDVFGKANDRDRDRDIDALYNRFEEIFIHSKQY